MYMFGVPNNIITNNGTQFIAREFKEFFADSGIKINYVSVSRPQNNGQVGRSNDMILQGLKPRIFDRLKPYAGKWGQSVAISFVGPAYHPESCYEPHTIFSS
jgi:transposase InsO family protein